MGHILLLTVGGSCRITGNLGGCGLEWGAMARWTWTGCGSRNTEIGQIEKHVLRLCAAISDPMYKLCFSKTPLWEIQVYLTLHSKRDQPINPTYTCKPTLSFPTLRATVCTSRVKMATPPRLGHPAGIVGPVLLVWTTFPVGWGVDRPANIPRLNTNPLR